MILPLILKVETSAKKVVSLEAVRAPMVGNPDRGQEPALVPAPLLQPLHLNLNRYPGPECAMLRDWPVKCAPVCILEGEVQHPQEGSPEMGRTCRVHQAGVHVPTVFSTAVPNTWDSSKCRTAFESRQTCHVGMPRVLASAACVTTGGCVQSGTSTTVSLRLPAPCPACTDSTARPAPTSPNASNPHPPRNLEPY